jgi:glutamate-1-semialdehyde 2,1-aminomutase
MVDLVAYTSKFGWQRRSNLKSSAEKDWRICPLAANWNYADLDARISDDIQGFLPDRLLDFHAHIYRVSDLHLATPDYLTEGPAEASIGVWREHIGRCVGSDRLQSGLFMGMPLPNCDIGIANDFLVEQLRESPGSRGLLLVSHATPTERVDKWLGNAEIVGFKPYHFFSRETPPFESSLDGFIPEWVWEMAHERSLIITLHLVRRGALADPDNSSYILGHCLKYPRAKLVLAHCARGFHSPNTVNGLEDIRGLSNVWFDTSAICEAASIVAVIREFGPQKVLWGTDFPTSEIRGRCVTAGDGFVWLQSGVIEWEKLSPACSPTLYGLESLRALREAWGYLGLGAADLQDVFHDNAFGLLDVKR